ncbi:hypothetical protein [Nonomuraea solani]|uniref:hypothetical protein n=1 Tax=Nonomuraea solani TaxID=1144553 RepID=UPI0011B0CAA1|nr:hypothetical protein [Nonomuraea solani]
MGMLLYRLQEARARRSGSRAGAEEPGHAPTGRLSAAELFDQLKWIGDHPERFRRFGTCQTW